MGIRAVVGLAVSEHVAVETVGEFAQGEMGGGADGGEDEKEGEEDGKQIVAAAVVDLLCGRLLLHRASSTSSASSAPAVSSSSRGRVTPKVLPSPGTLSTQTSPPWASTMERVIKRPRPSP